MIHILGKRIGNGFQSLIWFCAIVLVLKDHSTTAECEQSPGLSVGDRCRMAQKTEIGECVEETNCPALENLVKTGAIRQDDVCSCGWSTYGELVCCPLKTHDATSVNAVLNNNFWQNLFTTTTLSTPTIITTTTSVTTVKPDFWLEFLTTTTAKPLIVGGTELNTDSDFHDFSKLLDVSNNRPNTNNINNNIGETPADMEQSVSIGSQPVNAPLWQQQSSVQNLPKQTPAWGQQAPVQTLPSDTISNNFNGDMRPSADNRFPTGPGNSRGRGNGFAHQGSNRNHPNFNQNNRSEQSPRGQGENVDRFGSGGPNFANVKHNNGIGNGARANGRGNKFNQNSNNQFARQQSQQVAELSPNNVGNVAPWDLDYELFYETPAGQNPNGQLVRENVGDHRPWSRNTGIKSDPIAVINNNLINSGIDVIPAQLDSYSFQSGGANAAHSGWNRDTSTTSTTTTTTTQKPDTRVGGVPDSSRPRPAVAACTRFESQISPALTPHILDGIPADFGEFPHMAAIGYNSLGGNADGSYDFRCGGSLIELRFVLTAAHCVNNPNSQPLIVRLNIVDLQSAEQLRDVVDVGIKTVHLHPEYRGGSKYNDIALLELEREVPFTNDLRPACLYTDLADPPSSQPHVITGWGTVNTATRRTSPLLLKAAIRIVPLDRCNASYIEYGLDRHLASGIVQTQICAHDSNLKKDACQGDSGGPLNLVVDETLKTYRIVGVISAGHSCASSTPGLYTRVAAYLDYIESIVWPAT